jgi:hypothetical protein
MKKLGGHVMQFVDLSITSRNMRSGKRPIPISSGNLEP